MLFDTPHQRHVNLANHIHQPFSLEAQLHSGQLIQSEESVPSGRGVGVTPNDWWVSPSDQGWGEREPEVPAAPCLKTSDRSNVSQQNSWSLPFPILVDDESPSTRASLSALPEMASWTPTISSEQERIKESTQWPTAEDFAWANLMSLGKKSPFPGNPCHPFQWSSASHLNHGFQARAQNGPTSEIFTFPYSMSVSLPILRNPPVLADYQLHKFVMDAGGHHGAGYPSRIARPSVLDFFDNSTTNVLAAYVKTYLTQRRGFLRLHEALATFWTMVHHAKVRNAFLAGKYYLCQLTICNSG